MTVKHEGPKGYNCPACQEYGTSERNPCVSCGNGEYEEMWVPDCGAADVCHSVVVKLEQDRDRYKALLIKYMCLVGQIEGTTFIDSPQDSPRIVGECVLSPEDQKELWKIGNE